MDGSIVLGDGRRKRLLDPQIRLRTVIVPPGRPIHMIDDHRRAVLFDRDDRSLEAAIRGRRHRRPAGAEAWSPLVVDRVGGVHPHLGQDAHAAGLWLLLQPLVVLDPGGGPVGRALTPGSGGMWMERANRPRIVTSGTDVKRYLAGSMSWRNGELVVTQGDKRNAELFVAHLVQLRHHSRHRRIHVICDNARFHTIAGSKVVRAYLAKHGDRIVCTTYRLTRPRPTRSSGSGGISASRSRGITSATASRNWKLTIAWLDEHGRFKIDGLMYQRLKQAVT